ncbi:MAG: hypothetical protein ACI4V7_07080 [Succinivibrionaceae bacterium]
MNNTTKICDTMKTIDLTIGPLRNKLKSGRKYIDTLLHILSDVED